MIQYNYVFSIRSTLIKATKLTILLIFVQFLEPRIMLSTGILQLQKLIWPKKEKIFLLCEPLVFLLLHNITLPYY